MKLSDKEIRESLEDVTSWEYDKSSSSIYKMFTLQDFATGLDLVNDIGVIAEKSNHHPDITLGWGYVKVVLTTHSEGGVTDKDIAFAQEVDKIQN